jgi:XTP/dITP diphosphohydrolase
LEKLTLDSDRSAQFRTVLVLALKEEVIATFEGVVRGKIAYQRSGSKGFGYDPVFVPDGYKISFAEMTGSEKNNISHRAKALDRFITWLKLKSK